MSTTNDQTQDENQSEEVTELSLLKQRASMMGIVFSNNIGIEKLRERVNEKLAEEASQEEAVKPIEAKVKEKSLRQNIIDENMRLIRIRITNLDPKKSNLPGEIITVANEFLGTVRKFVPFGEVTDGGYHVPYCIYKLLKSRKFLNIRTVKNPADPLKPIIQQNWVNEFALEVLPQLTQEELDKLAVTQAASGGVG